MKEAIMAKKEPFINRFRAGFKKQIAGLAESGKPVFITFFLTIIFMGAACLATFFFFLQGEEQVMVPNVVGKSLTNALLEMQQKELYAKIQLRYSDMPGDIDTILEQSPEAGAIVKAYRRVVLTVSRGVAVDSIDDYVGKNVEEVLPRLQTLFGGDTSLVKIAPPVYQKSSNAEGVIIAQYPEGGTYISDQLTLQFIVSSGTKTEMVELPGFVGMTLPQLYEAMQKGKVILDFSSHAATESEKAGTITYIEKPAGSKVTAYSRIKADVAFAPRKEDDTLVNGILSCTLPEYPYPVMVKLESSDSEGRTKTLASFNHPGKALTVPYSVNVGSVLTLYVRDRQVYQQNVE